MCPINDEIVKSNENQDSCVFWPAFRDLGLKRAMYLSD